MKGQPHEYLHMVQGQIHRKYIDVSGELGTSLMCVGFDLVFSFRQPLLGNSKTKGPSHWFQGHEGGELGGYVIFYRPGRGWGRTSEDQNVLGQLEKRRNDLCGLSEEIIQ